MVDLPRSVIGIASIAKLRRNCKTFIRKCRHNKKPPLSSKEAIQIDEVVKANNVKSISKKRTQEAKRKAMSRPLHETVSNNNIPNHHYHYDGTNPSRSGNKENNSCFPSNYFSCSPLSRNPGSTRSPSRKSSTSSSSSPSPSTPAFVRKNLSRRNSNSIMFSNSSGLLKPPAIERKLECTLEELFYGCQKKIKITRDVFENTGIVVQEEELVTILVKPGWKKGTKITFEGMGNEKPGLAYPADITFIVAEKKHSLFRRDGDDLELCVEIPLVQALTGDNLSIPLLGGDKMSLALGDDVIYPGFEKVVPGLGMPVAKEQGKRGDLKVTLLVKFPSDLTDEQRSDLTTILQDSS